MSKQSFCLSIASSRLLIETLGNQRIREKLLGSVFPDKLQSAYVRAKDQADFLLYIEVKGRPSTYTITSASTCRKPGTNEWRTAFPVLRMATGPGFQTSYPG
ncbi:hypothetical protein N657DRAFT_709194 [Parathielavia appendiculata]|uniref:Uncharacterized protein n=1 Tax=Parathielavia appendiculata TaxID=2587402 RepID=A0AAN6Z5L8_9PEZI|nr:hypothetical protein N657DRAFT_709194 [Parathielavia appendiculata]